MDGDQVQIWARDLPDGALRQEQLGDSGVYLVEGGQKRWIVDTATLQLIQGYTGAMADAASRRDEGSRCRDRAGDVGRWVLFFAREPAALVRRLAGCVRDGGTVAFQEPASATMTPMSLPPSPLLDRLWAWILETYRLAGMGLRPRASSHR